ncbi:39S ribosomal protein L3, mitochondrial [Patella vulgata]|uniref:39S ribosomal protein L3, mitochondrial n=1 Tax=Patella vulgata TaxID=6465 RepID=UPI0021804898|nr:39S ribosomal protein L3, mitochondrial [Patella vulgata]
MAAPRIGNVLCRISNCNFTSVLLEKINNSRSWTCLQQIRHRQAFPPAAWYVKQKTTDLDENLTKENEEFLDDVMKDVYKKRLDRVFSPLEDGPWKRNDYNKYTRRTGVLAIKIGVVPQWTKEGKRFTTTMLQIIDNHVIRYTPPEKFMKSAGWKPWWGNKYGVAVVGALSTNPRIYTKEYNNLFMESGVPPKKKLTRFLITENAAVQPGTPLNVMHYRVGDVVDCSAKTIDHGFQGVVKRWGMKGMPKSHGVTKTHRRMGTTAGGKFKGGIWKGKKMPGLMGNRWRTARGLKIWRVNTKYNVLYVTGQNVPGNTHGFVRVMDTKLPLRKPAPENPPPMPTWYPEDATEPIEEEYFDKDLFQFTEESVKFAAEKK